MDFCFFVFFALFTLSYFSSDGLVAIGGNMPRVKPESRISTRLKLTHCVFCREPGTSKNPITDEHVWSDWLKKIIPRSSTRTESRIKTSTLPERAPRIIDPATDLMGAVHTKKAKVVCAKCNNEWMNNIVQAAIPAATTVILKKTTTLDLTDQKRLATWLALQAMMADLLAKEPTKLPHGDLDHLYKNKEPPPDLFIGIGCYLGPPFVAFNHNFVPLWSEDEHLNRIKVFSIRTLTSIIGGLYAIVSRADPVIPGTPAGVYQPYILQLWPNAFPLIPWPAPFDRQITGFFGQEGALAFHLATRAGDVFLEEFRKRGITTPPAI